MKRSLTLQQKASIYTLLLTLFISCVTIAVSFGQYQLSFYSHYLSLSSNVASTAARLLDPDAVAQLRDSVMEIYLENPAPQLDTEEQWLAYLAQYAHLYDENYQQIYTLLSLVREENDVSYVYLSCIDPQSMTAIYLVDADNSENICPIGMWDVITQENYEYATDLSQGFPAFINSSPLYGTLSTAGMPVKNDQGEVVGMVFTDVSMNEVLAETQGYLIAVIAIVFVTLVFFLLLVNYTIRRVLITPINHLASATGQFVQEQSRYTLTEQSKISKLQIKTGDEIENLCVSIQKMEKDMRHYIRDITHITAEKERLGAELKVATAIQSSMLPHGTDPFPEKKEFEIFATMTPAKEVGGDFYDFFLIDQDHLALVMADVSGKGVASALFMVVAKTLLKNACQSHSQPHEILEQVNKQLCENNDAGMFVTVWLGILQLSTGQLSYANGGHEYPCLQSKSADFSLLKEKPGMVLAAFPQSKYQPYSLQLQPHDVLFLYTDGVIEANSLGAVFYGKQRMLDSLNKSKGNPQAVLAQIQGDIAQFVGDEPQFDDLTMLCLQYHGKTRAEMTLPADKTQLAPLQAFVAELLTSEDILEKRRVQLDVALEEIFINIAQYAYDSQPGQVTIRCKLLPATAQTPLSVEIQFQDQGRAFNPLERQDPNTSLSAEERNIGGLGIFLVKKTMDFVDYRYVQGCNILTIQKIMSR